MTRDEVIKLLTLIKASYPVWAKELKQQDASTMIMLWSDLFEEYDFTIMQVSLKSHLLTSKWPPSVAELVEKYMMLTQPQKMSEGEAWAMVRKAISNGMYGAREEFERLPKDIQIVLREPATLKNWSQVELEEVDTVIASNFMRSYKEVRKRESDYNALPSDIKAMISGITTKMIE